MGSCGSKATSSSGDGGGSRRSKSLGGSVFRSSCLRIKSRSHRSDDDEQACEHQNKGSRIVAPCTNQTATEQDRPKEYFRKINVEQSDEMPSISSNIQINEWGDANITDTVSRTGPGSAQDSASPSLNPSRRFLSRFSIAPGNVSFRLSRATSLGSSRSYPQSSTSVTVLNDDDDLHLQTGPSANLVGRCESQEGWEFLPESPVNRAPIQFFEDTSASLGLNTVESGFSHSQTNSSIQVGRNANGRIIGVHNRYSGSQEPVEQNVRFSRTLSVGRLRDRVLRRSSLTDLTFSSLQQEGEVRDTNQGDDTRTLAHESSDINLQNGSGYPLSNLSNSLFINQDFEAETVRPRESRYHDLLEHRSSFLERRRRIRSQVRALQRLGSRFENVSGHERSCVLSGQQRTGHCTCRSSHRDAHQNDNSSARASISRIVMLAEALFEVLDEIHQQSVVLSSRPSVSSIGSVPAPNEVVESLPVKLFSKLQKHQHEEAAQCYICLVEYEEGDEMRILSCNHEFHKTCIDKWLKEIHRVCPLCRHDICRSDHPTEH
ncbi:uncharacterized protein LOC126793213 [Argentina anserina]|uniref:uncharacterized protein LOC126793213 n=1 Tax=Argentina anserina TaxID=57926 RepID=UPI0021767A79|nr:uncharacterized protein LOC126793213 [Potentilla anserina]